jgi:hypothetical protein
MRCDAPTSYRSAVCLVGPSAARRRTAPYQASCSALAVTAALPVKPTVKLFFFFFFAAFPHAHPHLPTRPPTARLSVSSGTSGLAFFDGWMGWLLAASFYLRGDHVDTGSWLLLCCEMDGFGFGFTNLGFMLFLAGLSSSSLLLPSPVAWGVFWP